MRFQHLVEQRLGLVAPQDLFVPARRRRIDPVEIGGQRQDTELRIEQRVAHFLDQISRSRIAHEGSAGVAANDRARK